jgi:hypothetical protein
MKMLLGAIHVHSKYSDGEFTLAELRQIFLSMGCSFVCMTDHAEAFDAVKLDAYVQECESLSDDRFRFVPGLEYECQARLHILGYGMTERLKTTDPREVIEQINALGGISVIAHPPDWAFNWIQSVGAQVKGIEVWNTKYDGRYAPRPETFELLFKMQESSPEIRAYYGLDLHWKRQFRGLLNRLECAALSRTEILRALSAGNYQAIKAEQELPPSGRLPEALMTQYASIHGRSTGFRRLVKRCKRLIDQTGIRIPAPVKAQLRRFF